MYPGQSTSLLSLLKNIKWSSILDGTSKTLNVINQAIPVVYQVKPIIDNAKTMFKVANIIKGPKGIYSSVFFFFDTNKITLIIAPNRINEKESVFTNFKKSSMIFSKYNALPSIVLLFY